MHGVTLITWCIIAFHHLLTAFPSDPRVFHWFWLMRIFFLMPLDCWQRAHRSTWVAVIARNVCGRERSCEYLLRAIRRRQRPGAVKYCAQPSVSSQWSKQTNPSDKQLGGLTFFSLAKVVFASAPGSLLLKSLLICHMALENSITTKNGDNHVALCGLAASLKIFM